MKKFLTDKFGQPTVYKSGAEFKKGCTKKGIVVLEIPGWSDATGHATLWDGKKVIDDEDHGYVDKATKVNFWPEK